MLISFPFLISILRLQSSRWLTFAENNCVGVVFLRELYLIFSVPRIVKETVKILSDPTRPTKRNGSYHFLILYISEEKKGNDPV